jgi:pSer/pThr/pTyr-binding forkhead associated (FHA) protein
MKSVTIGRSSKSDIVVRDSAVSQRHCQITQLDNGGYTLYDCGSTNGTFVNGKRISGQVALNISDVVQIGNTTLPWQKYFGSSETAKTIIVGRNSDNDISIDDGQASRHHCQISRLENGVIYITDLQSTNGTYVNGQRIVGQILLHKGDKVTIGKTLVNWESQLELPQRQPQQPQRQQQEQETQERLRQQQLLKEQQRQQELELQRQQEYEKQKQLQQLQLKQEQQLRQQQLLQEQQRQQEQERLQQQDYEKQNQQNSLHTNSTGNILSKLYAAPIYTYASLITFAAGLLSAIIITYLTFSYFGTEEGVSFSAHLHGYGDSGGHWFGMAAAVILGAVADFTDGIIGSKSDSQLARIGLWMANTGVALGTLFILLAIFAARAL